MISNEVMFQASILVSKIIGPFQVDDSVQW